MKNTTYTVSNATLTESELFQHLLNSPMRLHKSISTLIDAPASDCNVIDALSKCCESILVDFDIAETFSTALMSCEEDPAYELKMIIFFLEELLDGMRTIQNDFEILKEITRTEAADQLAI